MAHLLGELVSSGGHYFENLINTFENLTGKQSIDVDLVGQMLTATNLKLRELKLTPGDSRCEEVNQALIAKYKHDAELLEYNLLGNNFRPEFVYEQIATELNKITTQEVLQLKPEALQAMLKRLNPEETLSELELDSVEQLFECYRPGEIAVAVRLNEDQFWLDEWLRQIQNLSKDDFEFRPAEIYFINQDLAAILSDDAIEDYAIIAVLTGSVIVSRDISGLASEAKNLLALICDVGVKVSRLVASTNQLQVLVNSSTYAENITKFLQESTFQAWDIGGELIPWWSIFRAIGRSDSALNQAIKTELPQFNFSCFDATEWLVRQYPDLKFWAGTNHLSFKRADAIVSLNISDVIDNYLSKIGNCQNNLTAHFEESLWDELIFRYLNQPALTKDVIKLIKQV